MSDQPPGASGGGEPTEELPTPGVPGPFGATDDTVDTVQLPTAADSQVPPGIGVPLGGGTTSLPGQYSASGPPPPGGYGLPPWATPGPWVAGPWATPGPWATGPWATGPWATGPWASPGSWAPAGPWVTPGPWPTGAPGPGTRRAPAPGGRERRAIRVWRIVGGTLAGAALVALGIGIGFSTWGTTQQPVSASGRPTSPVRPLHPSQPLVPRSTPGSFPGTGSATPKNEAFLGVEIAPTSTLPAGLTANTSATAPSAPKSTSSAVAGAHVLGVVPTSPAAKAGIAKGDTITGFRTLRVVNAITLSFDVSHAKVGQSVRVDWVTPTGKHDHATVTLTTRRAANRSVG